jgi:hypothetical protein
LTILCQLPDVIYDLIIPVQERFCDVAGAWVSDPLAPALAMQKNESSLKKFIPLKSKGKWGQSFIWDFGNA